MKTRKDFLTEVQSTSLFTSTASTQRGCPEVDNLSLKYQREEGGRGAATAGFIVVVVVVIKTTTTTTTTIIVIIFIFVSFKN